MLRVVAAAAVVTTLFCFASASRASGEPLSPDGEASVVEKDVGEEQAGYGAQLASDGRYLVNNLEADAEDIVTAPLHVDALGDLLRKPATYYTLLGAGAALGGAFALDETLREHARTMSSSAALDLETAGTAFVAGGTVLLYGYGLQTDDARARQFALTGGASAGIASLVTLALKYGFGRTRPYQGKGAFNFFDHGQSFVSGETTPGFSLAAAVSEYFDNDWRVAVPMYSAALAVGVGRMGHDAHWSSDVVGSAIVGIGMTELLLYLHREHANDPSRFWIFPMAGDRSAGLELAFDW
jgi:membrane-associated phospholipid phosphatase